MSKTLYIVDTFSFIFRAFYAVRPLNAPDGTPVNAVYGVVSMFQKLLKDHNPDYLISCWESKDKNFRYDIFPEYKANRSEAPEELIPQIPLIKEYIESIPVKTLSVNGFEAEDVIATLVSRYSLDNKLNIVIVSSDKDLYQLISDKNKVSMLDTMKNKIIREKEVNEKFGVGPESVIDIQSLCGDSVDNIPGISGVGPKIAAKLITEFKTLDAVLENAEMLKGKLKERLINGKEDALLSKKLVTLSKDVPLKFGLKDITVKDIDQDKLNEFYEKLGFRSLIKNSNSIKNQAKHNYQKELITNENDLKTYIQKFRDSEKQTIAFDTETTSTNALNCEILGMSFCYENNKAVYIPIAHDNVQNLDLNLVLEIIRPLFIDKNTFVIGQNLKYDLNVLSQYGFDAENITYDTMIASYLIDPKGPHNLDHLAQKYLNYTTTKYSDIVGKGQTLKDIEIEKATDYACEDAWVVLMIHQELLNELENQNTTSVFKDVEMPLVSVLAKMEQNGILIDQKKLQVLQTEFENKIQALEKSIYALAGEEFNIKSPKQLGVILFEKLNLPVQKKTKTGYSTDVEVLNKLSKLHDLPKELLEFRTLTKLQSTYIEQLNKLIHPKSNRIHTSFNQAIAQTGRLSSSEPNLQNIPIRTTEGKRIRELFVSENQSQILSCDYSQIELRLLAELTQDENLVEAYQNNEDIHKKTASLIFNVPFDEVTDSQRSAGKTINFGVVYGQSAFGLANLLEVPQKEAKHFITSFFEKYPKVQAYKEDVIKNCKEEGFVKTILGRKRYFADINAKNFMVKQNAERQAFNTVFQGSAADLIKKAMLKIHNYLNLHELKPKMLLQVHDELIFEVPKDEMELVKIEIPLLMEKTLDLSVPLKVSFGFADSWALAH